MSRPLHTFSLLLALCCALPAQGQFDSNYRMVWRFPLGNEGAAWKAAYEPFSRQFWVIDREGRRVSCVQADQGLANPVVVRVHPAPEGFRFTDVKAEAGVVALAAASKTPGQKGKALVYWMEQGLAEPRLHEIEAGYDPVSCQFTNDGRMGMDWDGGFRLIRPTGLIVASKGRPDTSGFDPPGSITWLPIGNFIGQNEPQHFDFAGLRRHELDAGVHYSSDSAQPETDFEPEGLTFIRHYTLGAFIIATLPENNALALIPLNGRDSLQVFACGYQDFSQTDGGFDAGSDRFSPQIAPWPVYGMLQPVAVVSEADYYERNQLAFVTTDAGSPREGEAVPVSELNLDLALFPNGEALKQAVNLGRLRVSRLRGDSDGDGDHDSLFAFGGRCLSQWVLEAEEENGARRWTLRRTGHSGSYLERTSFDAAPERYNRTDYRAEAGSSSSLNGPNLRLIQFRPFFDGCIFYHIVRATLPGPNLFIDFPLYNYYQQNWEPEVWTMWSDSADAGLGLSDAFLLPEYHYYNLNVRPGPGWPDYYSHAAYPLHQVVVYEGSGEIALFQNWQFVSRAEGRNTLPVRMHPNPAADRTRIEADTRRFTARLLDLTGRQVWEGRTDSGTLDVPVENLPAGLYGVEVRSEDGRASVLKLLLE